MKHYTNLCLEDIVFLCPYDNVYKKEIWKDVVDYEGLYLVSSLGRFKSVAYIRFLEANNDYANYKEKILKQSLTRDGYLKVGFVRSKRKSFLSHRIVGESFIPNPKNKPQINHKKGIKDDNYFMGLEWNTQFENMQHAYANGLKSPKIGIKNGASKLTDVQVSEIIKIGNEITNKEIAKIYNVGTSTVCRVLNNKSWTHIK